MDPDSWAESGARAKQDATATPVLKRHLRSFVPPLALWWARSQAKARQVEADILQLREKVADNARSLAPGSHGYAQVVDELRRAKEELERLLSTSPSEISAESQSIANQVRTKIQTLKTRLAGESWAEELAAGQRELETLLARAQQVQRGAQLLYVLLLVMPLGLVLPFAGVIGVGVPRLWPLVLTYIRSSPTGMYVGVIGLVVLGLVLFLLRLTYRRTYAVMELAVAVATGLSSLRILQSDESTETLLKIAASVYLVVRGLDNFTEGHKQAVEHAEESLKEEDSAVAEAPATKASA